MNTFKIFLRDDSGATAIEYALLVALIAVVLLAVVGTLGQTLKTSIEDTNSKFSTANTSRTLV